jgi:hypothetical protein
MDQNNFNSSVVTPPVTPLVDKTKHVFISYHEEKKDICLKIKNKLIENGFKVWIDVDDLLSGSYLDECSKAINNCCCALICFDEKYVECQKCKLEAENIFKRPFIAINLQKNYKAKSLLGIMFGSKVIVDVECNEINFNDSMKNVINQIEKKLEEVRTLSLQQIATTMVKSKAMVKSKKYSEETIKNLAQKDVEAWLSKVQIDDEICKSLKCFDGKMLVQLNSVKKASPNYYFSAISRNNTIDIMHVLKFTDEFEKFFR